MENENKIKITSDPDIIMKDVSVREISNKLLQELRPKVKNLVGVRTMIFKKKIIMEIIINPSNDDAAVSNIAKLGFNTRTKYTISNEMIESISEFINVKNQIRTAPDKGGRGIKIMLNPIKTLNAILEKAPNGMTYEVDRIFGQGMNAVLRFKAVKRNAFKHKKNRKLK